LGIARMIRVISVSCTVKLLRLMLVSAICLVLSRSIAHAEITATAEIELAVAKNTERLAAVENELARATPKLEKLIELQRHGHASWLEVAQQRVFVESLKAQRTSASEFDSFVHTLRQHAS